jgi:hypothetical protein
MLQISDADVNEEVPFAQVKTSLNDSLLITNVNGQLVLPFTDSIKVKHPLYHDRYVHLDPGDSVFFITLVRKDSLPYSQKMKDLGKELFLCYQDNIPFSITSKLYSFDYLTYTNIKVLEQNKDKDWQEILKGILS